MAYINRTTLGCVLISKVAILSIYYTPSKHEIPSVSFMSSSPRDMRRRSPVGKTSTSRKKTRDVRVAEESTEDAAGERLED